MFKFKFLILMIMNLLFTQSFINCADSKRDASESNIKDNILAFRNAIKNGNYDEVKRLVENKLVDVNAAIPFEQGHLPPMISKTGLGYALYVGNKPIAELLIRNGAKVNFYDFRQIIDNNFDGLLKLSKIDPANLNEIVRYPNNIFIRRVIEYLLFNADFNKKEWDDILQRVKNKITWYVESQIGQYIAQENPNLLKEVKEIAGLLEQWQNYRNEYEIDKENGFNKKLFKNKKFIAEVGSQFEKTSLLPVLQQMVMQYCGIDFMEWLRFVHPEAFQRYSPPGGPSICSGPDCLPSKE